MSRLLRQAIDRLLAKSLTKLIGRERPVLPGADAGIDDFPKAALLELFHEQVDTAERSVGVHLPTRHVAGILVKIARNFARGSFRAALGFERTDIAIQLAGPVEQCPTAMNRTAGSQHLAVGQM